MISFSVTDMETV